MGTAAFHRSLWLGKGLCAEVVEVSVYFRSEAVAGQSPLFVTDSAHIIVVLAVYLDSDNQNGELRVLFVDVRAWEGFGMIRMDGGE